MQVEPVLSVNKAAQSLGCSAGHVRSLLDRRKLRGVRLGGGEWEIEAIDVRASLAKRNVSELVFEDYLAERGLGVPEHEPAIPGKSKKVDYRLLYHGSALWFEVKEFAEDPKFFATKFGTFDPYVPIRNKINKASNKFKEYGGECCSLVLYNDKLNFAQAREPSIVLASMLGDITYRVPISLDGSETASPLFQSFGKGGAMNRRKCTRISAVITVERLAVGKRKGRIDHRRKTLALGRKRTNDERYAFIQKWAQPFREVALRVVICENPFAPRRLPTDIFTGPYDERWGLDEEASVITRLNCGTGIAELEREEDELELNLGPLQRKMKHTSESENEIKG